MLIARVIAEEARLASGRDALVAALAEGGTPVAETSLLEFHGDTLELLLPSGDPATLRAAIDTHLGPADALIASRTIAVPQLFVSDMDSTMIGQECIDELADFAGRKTEIAAITERAMRGELDFESALRERVAMLEGLEESAIARCLEERIAPTAGARALIATLKASGCHCVLVTGGFHHFADPIAEHLGFDRVIGNRLAVADGKLTGTVVGDIVTAQTKARVLTEEFTRLGDDAISMAAGDGANDIPMIESADFGFAYRAKPKARAAANGWIDRGDLTAILKLLHVPSPNWVSS